MRHKESVFYPFLTAITFELCLISKCRKINKTRRIAFLADFTISPFSLYSGLDTYQWKSNIWHHYSFLGKISSNWSLCYINSLNHDYGTHFYFPEKQVCYISSFHTTLTLSRSFLITAVCEESTDKDLSSRPWRIYVLLFALR